MKRYATLLSIFCLALMVFVFMDQPVPTAAGGLPCFMCHGGNFEGSDLAPSVADTKLTDEEILKQIREPRGVMPAFPEFASRGIVDFIRSMPTGQPTAALSSEQRSAALATIAAVAAIRATAFALGPQVSETPIPPTPSPMPPASAALGASASTSGPTNPPAFPALANVILVIAGLLILSGSVWWIWQQRKATG